MPKIALYKYLSFFIVSYDLKERLHLHIIKTKGKNSRVAKIWLEPIKVFDAGDLSKSEINLAVKLIEKNKDEIKSKILNFAEGKKSKPLSLKLK
ncbi:MAG: DUF4160 domain-containing protein [Bacteroidetes bacterium]|nr:DUF4160 domain-containing protein [Bacteroidota bacterium]